LSWAGIEVGKSFRHRIVSVKMLIWRYPNLPGMIREESVYKHAAQTLRILWIRPKVSNPVAVIALQSVFRPKPEESRLVLDDLANPAVGRSLSERHGNKEKVLSF
jgi:hypothetical protein